LLVAVDLLLLVESAAGAEAVAPEAGAEVVEAGDAVPAAGAPADEDSDFSFA
jgi:hypothetical protein